MLETQAHWPSHPQSSRSCPACSHTRRRVVDAPVTRPQVRLRREEYERHAQAAGWVTRQIASAAIGMSDMSLWRTLDGRTLPGETFIAKLLAALPDAKFEDLFELVTPNGSKEGAA